jgi:hypothetical protein
MNAILKCCGILVMFLLAGPALTLAQDDVPPKALPEGTIRFDAFTDQPWKDIIEMYARQAGLELDMIEAPPTGTFQFQGNRDMTYLEALDFLNEKLIPRERILIRKRHMLYLFDTSKGLPETMIQTVLPEDLDERGRYEILKCKFDVKGLDAEDLRDQIRPLIDDLYRPTMTVVPVANLMVIQETGGRLRFIRDNIINAARENADNWEALYINLENAIPEDVIDAAVQNLALNRETRRTEDGSLSISIHPHGDKILATGDPATIMRLQKLVKAVDQPFDNPQEQRIEPFYASYRVEGNVELIHQVLQSMMSGRDIKLDFDEKTNRIHLFGRPSDHNDVVEVIEKTGRGSQNFSVVQINVMEIEEAREKIEEAFGLGGADAAEDEPTLTELPPNRLVVRGNPGIVSEIVQMLQQIDMPFQREPGTRTVRRQIPMTSSEVDRTMSMLSDVLPSLGINNQIDVILPGEQRWQFNRENRAFEVYRGDEILRDAERRRQRLNGENREAAGSDEAGNPPDAARDGDDRSGQRSRRRSDREDETSRWTPGRSSRSRPEARPVFQLVGLRQQESSDRQQDDPNGSGRTSDEQEVEESEPGAPITLYVNERGITLVSRDLDAGDALEDLIMEELARTSSDQNLQLFLLRYREAAEAKAQLERYLGLAGGGGGGSMTDMMGGFMRNALPGAAGGMAEALLGGGDSFGDSSGAVRELNGEVTIVADAKQYSLMISAVPEDMVLIEQLIDLIDQPTAIQNPNPFGRTRLIPVRYVDPQVLEGMVRANLATVLRNSEEAGGQERGNAEARAQQQMLRALLGRNGGGGDGGEAQESPKAALSVDTRNKMLVVTGPDFIYDQIKEFVDLVDTPVITAPSVNEFVAVGDIDINLLAEILQAQNPNIELMVDEQTGSTTTPTTAGTAGGATGRPDATAANPMMNNEAFRNAILQGMRGRRGGGARGDNQGGGNRDGGRGGFGGQRGGFGGQRGGRGSDR